ncbi:MAG TPA: hypothetical protein VHB78_06570 [Vicinamibacterales bacterium]|jgi:hypothetical protein|nr:hypothetical protein [Vicinamibacterales bacterium]
MRVWLLAVAAAAAVVAVPGRALAQSDEIQVYDGGLAPVGVFNLTLHNNFTPDGIRTPSFPGGVTSNRSFNGVPEWALGVTNWFEAGLYLPLYTHDETLGFGLDGFKLRSLFAVPHADDRRFVYGANFEFSINAKRWDTSRFTSEVRPILGWHVTPRFDVIVNPIVDTAYDGLGNLEFVPSARVAYAIVPGWPVAVETYSDFGRIRHFAPAGEQAHQIFAVVDHTARSGLEMEFGVGVGVTDASDRLTLKLILAKDLNHPVAR